MKTIHIIETKEEQELVKRIFDKSVKDLTDMAASKDGKGIENLVGGILNVKEDGETKRINIAPAMVYDLLEEGKWKVYDFSDQKVYEVGECDIAGLVNELPSDVFPF